MLNVLLIYVLLYFHLMVMFVCLFVVFFVVLKTSKEKKTRRMANRPASLSVRLELRDLTAVSVLPSDWTRQLSESIECSPTFTAL